MLTPDAASTLGARILMLLISFAAAGQAVYGIKQGFTYPLRTKMLRSENPGAFWAIVGMYAALARFIGIGAVFL